MCAFAYNISVSSLFMLIKVQIVLIRLRQVLYLISTPENRALMQSVENFVSQLRRLQVVGSSPTAMETAQLLRTVISNSRWSNAASLIATIKDLGRRLVRAQPLEFAVGNVIRRVLHLIREEYRHAIADGDVEGASNAAMSGGTIGATVADLDSSALSISSTTSITSTGSGSRPFQNVGSGADSSMFNLLSESMAPAVDYSKQCFQLKQLIIQGINEIIDELEGLSTSLSQQAVDHVQAHEVIMTIGRSGSVERFLLAAARKRSFTVIVAECAPSYSGHRMAAALSKAGIDTVLISDASIFSLMSRVNKVIIGCHAVTANGGIIAPAGCKLIADAARHNSVPLCVVAGLYKLTPIFPENGSVFNLLGNPAVIIPFSQGDLMEKVDVLNPQFDYVSPNSVGLFITNTGGHPPSYVYRLMRETYDLEDYVF